MSSISSNTVARSRAIIKSRKTQEYVDQLASEINERGDGLQEADVYRAIDFLKAYNYKTIKVLLPGFDE
jgi:hypothetical protein